MVREEDVTAGKVKIFAPEHFTDEAVSENVMAGNAMSRRASYMYGPILPRGPLGQVSTGLGLSTSSGLSTLILPSEFVKKTGEKKTIDGLEGSSPMSFWARMTWAELDTGNNSAAPWIKARTRTLR